MEISFIFFLLIVCLLAEVIEYDRSKYHMIIMILGLVTLFAQLDSVVDFNVALGYPLILGLIIMAANRVRIIGRAPMISDPDEDL